ncbi:MAG TPA: hypothetical protein VKA01_12285, partial [Vicinamibacteria bacterium]|nr:hypothetical protein [Vicinamibacteria bacterium]
APAPPRRSGSAMPLIVLGVALVAFLAVAAVGAWFLFLRETSGSQVVDQAARDVGTLPSATAPPETTSPPHTDPPATEAPSPIAEPTPVTTLPPPVTTLRMAGTRSTAPPTTVPRATRPAPPEPAETAGEGGSFLDDVPAETEADGRDAGSRVAEGFRSGSTSSGNFGATGRFQARERTPRNLAPTERPAVGTMRHIIDAQESFHKRNSRYGDLAEMKQAGTLFLDVPFQPNGFIRRGYRFEVSSTGSGFRVAAIPVAGGGRPFTADDSGIIRAGVD